MTNNKLRLLSACLGAGLLLAVVPGHAATVTYGDQTSWLNASNNVTAIGFEGLASMGSFKDYSSSTGYTNNGVNFVGYTGAGSYQLDVMDSLFGNPYYNFGSGALLRSPSYDRPASQATLPYIQVNLPANTTAFALDLATVSPNALTYQITLSNGLSYTIQTGNRPTLSFWGITTDNPMNYVDLTVLGTSNTGGTYGLIDNVEVGAAAGATQGAGQTPEACTFILIGGGLVGLRAMRKYSKLPAAAAV